MNGIEKITGQISADAQAEIEALTEKAGADAARVAAEYDERARSEAEAVLRRGREAAEQREERLASVAGLEARKAVLAAKQDMVSKAFDRALEQLCALPDGDYVALLAVLCAKAARSGREQVWFSQKDRNRVGKAVVTRANELLARQVSPKLPEELTETKTGAFLDKVLTGASALLAGTGMLTLAEGTRPIRGGVILSDGDVETNCSFEALVRIQRDGMASEVAKVLFD